MNIVTPWAPDGAKIIKSRLKKGWNLGMRSQSPSLNHFFGKLGCFNIYCFMESFKTTLMLSVLLEWAWETESTSDQCPPLCLRAPIIACVRFQGHNTYSQHSDSGGQWNTQISLWKWNSRLRKYKSIFTNCYASFFTYTYFRSRLKMRTSSSKFISRQRRRVFLKYTFCRVAFSVIFGRRRRHLYVHHRELKRGSQVSRQADKQAST